MLPTIDVVMATLDEERYIDKCLDHVIGQDYPPELVTLWLVDGGSTDRTVEIVRRRAEDEPRLRLIAQARRTNLPEALNLAISRSHGALVAKIDTHGYPERDFLRRAAEAFETAGPEVGCVGGMPEQRGQTRFGEALAIARGSVFGVGGGTYAISGDRRFVPSVQCGVYKRSVLDRVGSFDPGMAFGEDDELDWRVTQAGHLILLDRRIRFHYFTRPTWRAAFRQYRRYGEARVRVVRKHPGFLRAHHLAPAALVGGLAVFAAGAAFNRPARLTLAAGTAGYATATLAAALVAARPRDPRLAPQIATAFAALHLGYGLGMLRGLPAVMRRPA